jgi:hypothetical protein
VGGLMELATSTAAQPQRGFLERAYPLDDPETAELSPLEVRCVRQATGYASPGPAGYGGAGAKIPGRYSHFPPALWEPAIASAEPHRAFPFGVNRADRPRYHLQVAEASASEIDRLPGHLRVTPSRGDVSAGIALWLLSQP